MITIIHKNGKGKSKEIKVEELDLSNTVYKTLTWIDCKHSNDEELKVLTNKTGVSIKDLKICFDEKEVPRVELRDTYSFIIYRAAYVDKSKKEISTIPVGIFVGRNYILTVRKKGVKNLRDIYLEFKDGKDVLDKETVGSFVYQILSKITFRYFDILDLVEDDMEELEEKIFTHSDPTLVETIFKLKKVLIYFNKALVTNRDALINLNKIPFISIKDKELFRNLYIETLQGVDMVATYRDILTGALDIYLTSASNNLNEIIRKLTVYGSFVLVPTLIASVYGMNFKFMPEIPWIYGYPYALGLMVVSVIFLYIFFNKKGWI